MKADRCAIYCGIGIAKLNQAKNRSCEEILCGVQSTGVKNRILTNHFRCILGLN